MRLWRIHPKYLDQKGLCGLWREALQANRVLTELRGGKKDIAYGNHPQLRQFKLLSSWIQVIAISDYIVHIWAEGRKRGYKFDASLVPQVHLGRRLSTPITVTKGQIAFESELLKQKVMGRAPGWWKAEWDGILLEPHPIFNMTDLENTMCEKKI